MHSQGGGASNRSGFEYQDIATAYFSITDDPSFINKQPIEFRIEQPADFLFSISFDDYDQTHFFEAKHRSSGSFTWQKFKNDILPTFSELHADEADGDDTNFYHLVTDSSFNDRLKRFFDHTRRLRDNNIQWPHLQSLYQERNVNQIEKHTGIEDEKKLSSLVGGIMGHFKTQEQMYSEIENYVRACNSPGNYRGPTENILRIIGRKDKGVIRRPDLEDEVDISLRKQQSSASTSDSNPSLSELKEQMEELEKKFTTSESGVAEAREDRATVTEFTEQITNSEEVDENVAESWGASMDENLSRLVELRSEEEQLMYTLSQEAKRGINLAEETSTDSPNQS